MNQRAGFMQRFGDNYVAVKSEREFKKVVRSICEGMPLATWRQIAAKNQSLLALASPKMLEKARRANPNNPGVRYLMGLSRDQVFALIAEAAPEHSIVLQQHPAFAEKASHEIRSLVGGEV